MGVVRTPKGCVLVELGTDDAECRWKVVTGSKVAGTVMSQVNARGLQLEFAKVLHDALLMLILLYSRETKIWKEKERSRIMPVQMYDLTGLLGTRRMYKVLNAWIRKVFGMRVGVLRLFGHVERMDNDKIAKTTHVGECGGSVSVKDC